MATGTKGLKAVYRNNLIPYTELMADIQVEIEFPALGLHIGNEQLVDGAFGLEESLCSESSLTFGCCEAAKLCFTVAGVEDELKGQRFTV
ncbi:MAG: hypothetical protein K2O03_08390, partial [Lachnospiraceae bacterium]|nr:hypothetical protein [Lachnospiraceae bacterium]